MVILMLVFGGGWYWTHRPPEPIAVKVVNADGGRISSRIRATGVVQSDQTVHVTAMQPGVVSWMGAKVGDRVKRGQLLFSLDDAEAKGEVQEQVLKVREAANGLDQARTRLKERQQERKLGGGTQEAVRQARVKVDNEQLVLQQASKRLDILQQRLERRQIRAPINGTVFERKVNEGEYVQVGTKLLVLVGEASREILVKAEPEDASKLELGMSVEVVVEGNANSPAKEKLMRIEPSVRKEGAARYLPVWVSADDEDMGLRLNQQVDVNFDTTGPEVNVRIPLEAVVSRNGRDQVWRISQDRLELQPVELGILGDKFVEIAAGLNAGDQVVLLEGKDLQEGTPVMPMSSSEAKP